MKIDKASTAFIRPAGASMPIPDPAILADPNTFAGDPTKTPEQGKRKILTPQ